MSLDERLHRLHAALDRTTGGPDVDRALVGVRSRVAARRRRRSLLIGAAAATVALVGTVSVLRSSDDDDQRLDLAALPIGPPDSPYWIAADLPRDYSLVDADDFGGGATLRHFTTYELGGDPGDGNFSLQVTTSAVAPTFGTLAEAEATTVRGHPARRLPLSDDGTVYGVTLVWEERPGLWIRVDASEPLTEADAARVAEGVQPLPADRWSDLVRGLSSDPLNGALGPGATAVEALTGTVAGDTYRLIVLVPGDYPLSPEDRRPSCYRLMYREESTPDVCDTHPAWRRVGGQIFVFGPAGPDTREVRISPLEGSTPFEPEVVPTVSVQGAPPERFYAHPFDDGTCFIEVSAVGGGGDRHLGPNGPRAGDPEHAACLAQS